MLVEITEIGTQILQMGLVVEQLHAFQHQRQIDHHGREQWRQREQEEEEQNLGA